MQVVGARPGPSPFVGIEPFTLAEVQEAMFKIRCGRGAGGDGLVLELFNMALLVHTLVWCEQDSGFYVGVQRSKRCGEKIFILGDTRCSQWFRRVPIAVTYKIFAKILDDRLQPLAGNITIDGSSWCSTKHSS